VIVLREAKNLYGGWIIGKQAREKGLSVESYSVA